MLHEEAESFSKDDDDIGCIEDLKLKLNLSDQRPVQKTYNHILKPLFPEVKQHIEDLLNRSWIKHSKSAYSSPVVCARKRDGSLRLCMDFRELNCRTFADRHSLPLGAGNPREFKWEQMVQFTRPGARLSPGIYG